MLRRNDGVAAYNLAVVVDDAAQGIDQVVRGDDLLTSAPRQAYLGSLLGLPRPRYAHVPLALNPDGQRLAKRDGAVTLADLATLGTGAGRGAGRHRGVAAAGGAGRTGPPGWPAGPVRPASLPREPWIVTPCGPSIALMPMAPVIAGWMSW